MTSAVMMERNTMTLPSMGTTSVSAPAPTMAPNMLMVPRCTFKIEKCQGGMKLTCVCPDQTSCAMMQNLCSMLQGGLCGMCCMLNGMMVCHCNFTMGMCKCDMTKDGCCVTCTSGDQKCCDLIQSCCDCLTACMKAGCTCCLMMNNTPVCCGTC